MALRLKASESETNNESTHYQPTTLSVYQIACRAGQHDHRKYHRPHSEHRAFDIQVVLQSEVKPRDHDHQRYGRQADRERSEDRAPDIPRHDIADVGRAVDRDRPRRHLRNSNDVGQFTVGQPMMSHHNFVLDQRKHRITAAEAEKPDFQVRI